MKLLKGFTYVPLTTTDKLKGYEAARRELFPGVEYRQHRHLNGRAENSHQPTRQCERRVQAFKSPGQAHRFLTTYGPMASYFRPRRHALQPKPIDKRRPNVSRVGKKSSGQPQRKRR